MIKASNILTLLLAALPAALWGTSALARLDIQPSLDYASMKVSGSRLFGASLTIAPHYRMASGKWQFGLGPYCSFSSAHVEGINVMTGENVKFEVATSELGVGGFAGYQMKHIMLFGRLRTSLSGSGELKRSAEFTDPAGATHVVTVKEETESTHQHLAMGAMVPISTRYQATFETGFSQGQLKGVNLLTGNSNARWSGATFSLGLVYEFK